MGGSPSVSFPNWIVKIEARNGYKFSMYYYDLVDHILLLREVLAHPDMMQDTGKLNHYIHDYCQRMNQEEMKYKFQQSDLPWQIDWIWHVHRLHPVNYHRDCFQRFPYSQLVDKKVRYLTKYVDKTLNSSSVSISTSDKASFIPSIDLAKATLRQNDFLNKFKNHSLYSLDLNKMGGLTFEQMVQNYVSFILLARQNELIVPTFDIDLMWHAHMRYPSRYEEASKALCGFLLDHNDSLEADVLSKGLKQTAERWKKTYQADYGKNIDRNKSQVAQCGGSCAIVLPSFREPSSGGTANSGDNSVEKSSDGGGSFWSSFCSGGDGGDNGCGGD